MGADKCVICGEIIPEGIMVCPVCEKSVEQAAQMCYETNMMSCDYCPIKAACNILDADLLCCIIARINKKSHMRKEKV